MEHRWGDRIDCSVAVKLLADPASIGWGRICNISGSGGFIETHLRVRPLSVLRMWRTIGHRPVQDGEAICAIVVRSDANGIGVEWMEGDSAGVTAILRLAAFHDAPGHVLPQARGRISLDLNGIAKD